MPARTNDFQQLVDLIQRALVPEGAIVTESAMVSSHDGTEPREIDVLIETEVGPYRLKIAVEAKDHSRKMDITQFESIIGKYSRAGGVVVQKIVVVSHKGFAKTVYSRAKQLDIDLVVLSEVDQVDWSRLRPNICLVSKLDLVDIQIETVDGQTLTEVTEDCRLVCSCGRLHGTPNEYARFLFWGAIYRDNREELQRVDLEVIAQDRSREIRVCHEPVPPHELTLQMQETTIRVKNFCFNVRMSKPVPAADVFAVNAGFSIAPFVCAVKCKPIIAGVSPKDLLDKARIVCSCCRKEHGTFRHWATEEAITRGINRRADLQERILAAIQKSQGKPIHANCAFPFPSKYRVVIDDVHHQVESVECSVHMQSTQGTLKHTQFQLCRSDGSSALIDAFDGHFGETRLRMVMPEGLRSKRVALRVDGSDKSRLPADKKRKLEKRRSKIDQRKPPPSS